MPLSDENLRMRRLSLQEFSEERGHFDEAVIRSPGLLQFCSSTIWQEAAHDCLRPPGQEDEHFIVEDEGNWLLFAEREGNRVFFPFEAAWMFGCPVVGDPLDGVALLKSAAAQYFSDRVGFCLGGIPKDAALHRSLRSRQSEFLRYEEFPATDCMMIDLGSGYDAWLERRSKKFRKSVRQLRVDESIEIIDRSAHEPDELFERILRIQQQTYKWEEGTDIFLGPEYRPFYRRLLEELRQSGRLRLLFAQRAGQDLAYIFGGISGNTYRGFQMGYVEAERKSALGNVLQHANLRARAEEGITTYDLGMHSEYKERWADRREEFVGAFLVL
ncbi:MAG: GNAT family N-acetyltransferase [Verrucomicrobiales bacterium]|nr:GNAT family N-acetyltransferase [Verrucomicrobiales bacterium]